MNVDLLLNIIDDRLKSQVIVDVDDLDVPESTTLITYISSNNIAYGYSRLVRAHVKVDLQHAMYVSCKMNALSCVIDLCDLIDDEEMFINLNSCVIYGCVDAFSIILSRMKLTDKQIDVLFLSSCSVAGHKIFNKLLDIGRHRASVAAINVVINDRIDLLYILLSVDTNIYQAFSIALDMKKSPRLCFILLASIVDPLAAISETVDLGLIGLANYLRSHVIANKSNN